MEFIVEAGRDESGAGSIITSIDFRFRNSDSSNII